MSDNRFETAFNSYVCEGDEITAEIDGFTVTARIERDDTLREPWKEFDGHGPVTDWTSRDKAPGERVLNEDGRSKRFYDFAEAVKIARRHGWGVEGGRKEGETAGAYAARAAEHDFAVLKAWCDDEWHYCGVVVTVEREGVELASTSLWGVEANYPGSENEYLTTVANELVDEALDEARAKIDALASAR